MSIPLILCRTGLLHLIQSYLTVTKTYCTLEYIIPFMHFRVIAPLRFASRTNGRMDGWTDNLKTHRLESPKVDTKLDALDVKTRAKVLQGTILETFLKTLIIVCDICMNFKENGSFHSLKYRTNTGVLLLHTF